MGIISSLPENSKINSQKRGSSDASDGWRDQYKKFMKEGPCEEIYMDFQNCMNIGKKSSGECSKELDMCMEAHSDYYQPLLESKEAMWKGFANRVTKDLMNSDTPVDELKDEEFDKLFAKLREEACCKEALAAWAVNCFASEEEAKELQLSLRDKKKNKDEVNCGKLMDQFLDCIDDHPDHPFFAFKKTFLEDMEKDYETLFSESN